MKTYFVLALVVCCLGIGSFIFGILKYKRLSQTTACLLIAFGALFALVGISFLLCLGFFMI